MKFAGICIELETIIMSTGNPDPEKTITECFLSRGCCLWILNIYASFGIVKELVRGYGGWGTLSKKGI